MEIFNADKIVDNFVEHGDNCISSSSDCQFSCDSYCYCNSLTNKFNLRSTRKSRCGLDGLHILASPTHSTSERMFHMHDATNILSLQWRKKKDRIHHLSCILCFAENHHHGLKHQDGLTAHLTWSAPYGLGVQGDLT